jgi:hypothetical protein
MSTPSSLWKLAAAAAVTVSVTCATTPLRAQTARDTENGRYTFSQTSDGSVLRLDTRTGGISTCTKHPTAGWACRMAPDERDALDAEIGRLQADNSRLKEELTKRDVANAGSKADAQPPNADASKPGDVAEAAKPGAGNGGRIELQLPDDQDIDRVVAFLERAWRRLVEAANRMQRDVSGKI